ncbi:MAG: FHIPEP family type III secretion protein [Syntrophobacteraceae bacterium]|jgi:tetratricopeptide (TPR) repeat protein|nr:FHIPEP family type III secretion protein [Syntrophobacteraceae bacterium]
MSRKGHFDILEETLRLLGEARDQLARRGSEDWRLRDVLDCIERSAAGQVSFDPVVHAVRQALDQVHSLETSLGGMVKKLESLEIRRVRHGSEWWAKRREEIRAELEREPGAGFELWLRTVAEAIVAWSLDVREELLERELPLPDEHAELPKRFSDAVEAVRAGRHADPLVPQMVTRLLSFSGPSSQPLLDQSVRAALLTFRGRVVLHDAGDPVAALADFEEARRLAPQDPLPLAGLGEHSRAIGETRGAEGYFQQAVLMAPDQLFGHIGLGLCAEDNREWASARELFGRAAQLARDERDPVAALGRLRAPAGGSAYFCLAELLQLEDLELALAAVEKALETGIRGEGSYPESVGHRLRADLLERLGRAREAGQAYLTAARLFHYDFKSAMAEELLQSARRLAPGVPEAGWQLADVHLVLSFGASDPGEKADHVRKGMEVWEETARSGLPAGEFYWAHLTRARLAEQEASLLPPADWRRRLDLFGQAILYVERSLILKQDRELAWVLLARYFRLLGLWWNGVMACERAWSLDSSQSNIEVMEERIIALTNDNEVSKAEELLKGPFDPEQNLWSKSVLSFLRYRSGDYGEAVRLAQEAIKAQQDAGETPDFWQLETLANGFDMLGDRERADREWSRILDRAGAGENARGYAASKLGRYNEAVEVLSPLVEDPFQRSPASLTLALCSMVLGDMTAAENHLARSLDWSSRSALNNWLEEDVSSPRVRDRIPADMRSGFEERIRVRAWPRAAAGDGEDPAAGEEEIHRVMGDFLSGGADGGWIRIGLEASLARLAASAGRLLDAAVIYNRLIPVDAGPDTAVDSFWEGRLVLDRLLGQVQEDADSRARSGRAGQAMDMLRAALELARYRGSEELAASIEGRIGTLCFMEGEIEAARDHFVRALAGMPDGGAAVGTACSAAIDFPKDYYALRDFWEQWRGGIDAGLRPAMEEASASLSRFLDTHFQLRQERDLERPISRIALELSPDLVPSDTSPEAWPFLGRHIPDMRNRLEEETGVLIPGVRIWVRNEPNPSDTMLVFLNEIPLVIEAARSIDGADPMPRLADRLGEILLPHLSRFLDLDDVESLVSRWRKDPELNPLIQSVLPNRPALVRFGRILRALAREMVPLTRPRHILDAVRETGLSDHPGACVKAARLRLREVLPGNGPGARRIRLPEDLEDAMSVWLWEDQDGEFMAAPPEDVQEWFSRLREIMAEDGPGTPEGNGARTVLITRRAHLREPLRRLLEFEFPRAMTLSEEEVMDGAELEILKGETLA